MSCKSEIVLNYGNLGEEQYMIGLAAVLEELCVGVKLSCCEVKLC